MLVVWVGARGLREWVARLSKMRIDRREVGLQRWFSMKISLESNCISKMEIEQIGRLKLLLELMILQKY